MRRAIVAMVVLLAACTPKAAPVTREQLDAAPPPDAAAPAAPVSAFGIVSEHVGFELARAWDGPVLLVDRETRAVYETDEGGGAIPLEPLASLLAERVPAAMRLGRITGVWPNTVHVELAAPGGRSRTVIENYVLDAAKRTLTPAHLEGFAATVMPWRGGRRLGFDAESSSLMGPFQWRTGRFFVSGAPGGKLATLPALPKDLAFGGRFVAYESGHVFTFGGAIAKPDVSEPIAGSYAWRLDVPGPAPARVELPAEALDLERGRTAEETLVYGADFVRRFDGTTWVPVAAPEGIQSLSIGADGSVWLVAREVLYRADFPSLAFTPQPLPMHVRASEVAARSATDVWLRAEGGLLLHAPIARPIAFPADEEDVQRGVLSGKEPAPWTPACRVPFLLLGAEGEATVEEVRAVALPKDIGAKRVLARLKSGRAYGVEVDEAFGPDPARTRALAAWAAGAKTKKPGARFFCTRGLIEKELD